MVQRLVVTVNDGPKACTVTVNDGPKACTVTVNDGPKACTVTVNDGPKACTVTVTKLQLKEFKQLQRWCLNEAPCQKQVFRAYRQSTRCALCQPSCECAPCECAPYLTWC